MIWMGIYQHIQFYYVVMDYKNMHIENRWHSQTHIDNPDLMDTEIAKYFLI